MAGPVAAQIILPGLRDIADIGQVDRDPRHFLGEVGIIAGGGIAGLVGAGAALRIAHHRLRRQPVDGIVLVGRRHAKMVPGGGETVAFLVIMGCSRKGVMDNFLKLKFTNRLLTLIMRGYVLILYESYSRKSRRRHKNYCND